jgi:hypothetical protein
VKYFFIKDKVNQGEVTIKHCLTGQMWTDINTKSKKSIVYRVFRGHMMGIPADYNNSNYVGKVPVSSAVPMLPLTKEQLKTWLGIPIFGSSFWNPHRKQNSDSVFNSKDSGQKIFLEFRC